MPSTKLNSFILILIYWLLLFGTYFGFKEYTLNAGKEVVLKVIPVDPSDFLRGDYVILGYEISTLDTSSNFQFYNFRIGDEVYVLIDKNNNDGGYTVAPINAEIPSSETFLRGTITDVSDTSISLTYNIEKFFIQRGTGREIEESIRRGNAYVTLSVDKFGNAVIKELKVGNKILK